MSNKICIRISEEKKPKSSEIFSSFGNVINIVAWIID